MSNGVQSGTAVECGGPYASIMRTDYMKTALIAVWVLAAGILAFTLGVTSFVGWVALAVWSIVPPAIMLRLWSKPSPSMSETIREVLR